MAMAKFYWSLLLDIPKVLRGTTEAYLFWIYTVATNPLFVYFVPAVRPVTENNWWMLVVPIALGVSYGMLRVNYLRYKELHDKINGLEAHTEIVQKLREYYAAGDVLARAITSSTDDSLSVSKCNESVQNWNTLVVLYLDATLSPTHAHVFDGTAAVQLQNIPAMKSVATKNDKSLLVLKIYNRLEKITGIIGELKTIPTEQTRLKAAQWAIVQRAALEAASKRSTPPQTPQGGE